MKAKKYITPKLQILKVETASIMIKSDTPGNPGAPERVGKLYV